MRQLPRAAHDTVQPQSARVPVLNQSPLCWPALTIEGDGAQLTRLRYTGTGSAVGSVLNLKCHKSNGRRQCRGISKVVVLCQGGSFPCVAPWLCCTCACCFCSCPFCFHCASVLMLLGSGTVFQTSRGYWSTCRPWELVMSGTVLCYMVWCGSAAHSLLRASSALDSPFAVCGCLSLMSTAVTYVCGTS